MLNLLKSQGLENVADFKYLSATQIQMPSSKILIGTGGSLDNASVYQSGSLTFDVANGSGDNGFDTGTVANNQWYALYAVPGVGSAYILKATTRHPISSPGPAGYSKWRYLGIFRAGYSSNVPASSIVAFGKSGAKYSFWNPSNANAYGISLVGSSGPVNAVSASITTMTYGMTGDFAMPFDGALYKWNISTMNAANGTGIASLKASFQSSGLEMFGQVSTGFGTANTPTRPGTLGFDEFWMPSTCTQIAVDSLATPATGTYNWRVCLQGLVDPILDARMG